MIRFYNVLLLGFVVSVIYSVFPFRSIDAKSPLLTGIAAKVIPMTKNPITPLSPLDKWVEWYNQDSFLVQSMILDAEKLKGASVRPMLAVDSTSNIPWLRIVYDDCTAGTCVVRNYGHLKPKWEGNSWTIETFIYPDKWRRQYSNDNWILKEALPADWNKYVRTYYPLAVEHERKYKINRFVKLAQAILESGAGTSSLARAGNHFGIKKFPGYKGKIKLNKDEGTKKWAFTTSSGVIESFEIHSQFLLRYDMYDGVFNYQADSVYEYTYHAYAEDYWKKGSKKPVYHNIDGKRVKLIDGHTYTLLGMDIICIELSRAGYATDYYYSESLMNIIKQICYIQEE